VLLPFFRASLLFFHWQSIRSNSYECRETQKAFQYGKLFVTPSGESSNFLVEDLLAVFEINGVHFAEARIS
jgi:hypothetical protein